MIVKLYKQCILNEKYSEVFRNKELVDEYLNRIFDTNDANARQVLDDTYIKLDGKLILYIADTIFNLYDYNYLTIENNHDKIYCFINNIEVQNEALIINYVCDVWTTFSGKWSLRESFMSNALWTKPNEPYELPLDYIRNGYSSLVKLEENNGVDIIFKIQLYETTSGKAVGLTEKFVMYHETNISFTTISQKLDDIYSWQQINKWDEIGGTQFKYYANIIECYILPNCFNIETCVKDYNNGIVYRRVIDIHESFDEMFYVLDSENTETNKLEKILKEYSRLLQKRTNGIGLFTSLIPCYFNGIEKSIIITVCITQDTFNIYMILNGNRIEITELFSFVQDYNMVTADIIAQREIARKTQTAKGIAGLITSAGRYISGAVKFDIYSLVEDRQERNIGFTGATKDLTGGLGGLISSITTIANANANKYMSFTPADNNTSALINAYYGIVFSQFTETNVANNEEVKSAIKECGYNVDYFVNDLDYVEKPQDLQYNIVKFRFIRINGCTTEINNKIESILTNGVKVWYDSDI